LLPTFADPPLHSPLSPMPSDLRETAGFSRMPSGSSPDTSQQWRERSVAGVVDGIAFVSHCARFGDAL